MPALVSIKLYDDNDEVIKTLEKSVVKWGIMKKAIRLGKSMDVEDFNEDSIDTMSAFVCEIFDNKVTTEELEKHADMGDIVAVFKAVINKAKGMNISPN